MAAIQELERVLSTGKKVKGYERLRDHLRFIKDALLYKKNFNAVRFTLIGGLIALLGYMMYCQGELFYMDAEGLE